MFFYEIIGSKNIFNLKNEAELYEMIQSDIDILNTIDPVIDVCVNFEPKNDNQFVFLVQDISQNRIHL